MNKQIKVELLLSPVGAKNNLAMNEIRKMRETVLHFEEYRVDSFKNNSAIAMYKNELYFDESMISKIENHLNIIIKNVGMIDLIVNGKFIQTRNVNLKELL